jgi:ferrous iron transport protein A
MRILHMHRERRRVRRGEGWLPETGSAEELPGLPEWDEAAEGERAGAGGRARLERLSELKAGEEAAIQGFDAGHGLISRLSALGFTPQAQVTMLQNFGSGPVIVKMRDTRIALGRGEAMKVWVTR